MGDFSLNDKLVDDVKIIFLVFLVKVRKNEDPSLVGAYQIG
jgi:hypothetical protein